MKYLQGRNIIKIIETKLNNYSIRKKLNLIYVWCVLFPLIVTDTAILLSVLQAESQSRRESMARTASAVEYSLDKTVQEAVTVSKNIYFNKYINSFLNTEFSSPLDYYNQYLALLEDSLFDSSLGMSSMSLTMYADNNTIVNGGKFQRLETIEEQNWYQEMVTSGKNMLFTYYYDDSKTSSMYPLRKASFVRRLNRYIRDPHQKWLKIDLDYTAINHGLQMAGYDTDVYVCCKGDILFSNGGYVNSAMQFVQIEDVVNTDSCYRDEMEMYGSTLTIYVLPPQFHFFPFLWNNLLIILLLVFINIFMPLLFMRMINRSFTERLSRLSDTFGKGRDDHLEEVSDMQGSDEIGILMRNYNKMAAKTNDLIQTVYKSRLKQQESNIAKQKAELLALHSQINPHFLFNVLENIRMRSVLKHEDETAEMIEQLALMERQYVEWGTDEVTLEEEAGFVSAYLKLQKYRFGDRLSYQIEIEDACKGLQVPKLSLVTFTENACVHGVEDKASKCWVFVRVYERQGDVVMEIEDTGNGMNGQYLAYLQERMEMASIEMLKTKGRVGIVNACLRLKLYTENLVRFQIESEKEVGTMVTITAPRKSFKEKEAISVV